MFESLWIDKADAEQKIAFLAGDVGTQELGRYLADFHKDGFAIIPNAVSHEVIDQYIVEFDAAVRSGELKADAGAGLQDAKDVDAKKPATKILDVHALSLAAQKICFASPLMSFLECLFEETPLAFQTLHFERGSTQTVHNDTAYVVLNEPKSLAACWVALEDISPGSGELIYYPGSHRFEDYLYQPHRKHFVHHEDGDEKHHGHLRWIHETAAQKGISLQSFLPKKGDALIWHADLAHGGGPITNSDVTRRSLVTHYCPARCTPHYFRYRDVEDQIKLKSVAGGYISSAYYKLERKSVVALPIVPQEAKAHGRSRVTKPFSRLFAKTRDKREVPSQL